MIIGATIPVAINGRRVGAQNPGVRRHVFWQEFNLRLRDVTSEDAPLVAAWDAAFDERLSLRTSRKDWGTYPADGQQNVRHYDGAFWRQAMHVDVVEGEPASRVYDAGTFAEMFERPTHNLLLSSAPLPTVGKGKPVVQNLEDYIDLLQSWSEEHKTYQSIVSKLQRGIPNNVLIVDDTVYIRCAEPMLELSDCAVLDKEAKCSLLIRVITDPKEIQWRTEHTPHRLFPLSDFDEAMAAAPEAGFEASFGVDKTTGVAFNEVRRPSIFRPDLLTHLDYRSFQALNDMRLFVEECERTERLDHNLECARLHAQLKAAIADHDKGDVDAFGRVEDLVPLLHAAWNGTWMDRHTEKVMASLDERPLFMPQVSRGPNP
ncbi:hypothetical protein [Rhizobium sp. BK176]|uniref:hypothetical protein n=1 Tax=Rhizobium sp. BK176 TaxID=2587071 RepID=UPI00216A3D91|nr:hypothetical protein [Rhizobium sp. BK176]MCS4089625.1 hypothetical protein [Rhizobium sp. BK176]